jgi:hypothetical protein
MIGLTYKAIIYVFLGESFANWQQKKKYNMTHAKVFWWKRCDKVAEFQGVFLKYPYFDLSSSPKYISLEIFLTSSLTYSQIWLIFFMDDRQHGYITKVEKKNLAIILPQNSWKVVFIFKNLEFIYITKYILYTWKKNTF